MTGIRLTKEQSDAFNETALDLLALENIFEIAQIYHTREVKSILEKKRKLWMELSGLNPELDLSGTEYKIATVGGFSEIVRLDK